ncbi:Transcriptional regulator [Mesorhizobium plurifarium]|uniref:Transcriptional regulator n=1 Tax=Mesorhizobium plurifarium TaxID=69974 RepID=A0A090EUZ7_MESPL|nr:Transcriptional regulator [Mesorhizobium sp. SOD10]CDX35311.1 Transcriptional regulator [Mesorhizobium plurifarium]
MEAIGGKTTLAEDVYDRIRWDIVLGRLQPGNVLRSDWMREQYQVGISPLREALTRLTSERLIIAESQRGFRVAPLSAIEVKDVLETRLLIETRALRQSIAAGSVEWEGKVLSAYHILSRKKIPQPGDDDILEWFRDHKRFHMDLLSASHSAWLRHLSGLLFDQSERFRIVRMLNVAEPTLRRDVDKEHKRIVDACLARDPDEACRALVDHYTATADAVLANLAKGEAADRENDEGRDRSWS